MSPWTYASAWHLWKLHDLMPSIISHLKASRVHLSHYLSSYKGDWQGKFLSSEISLPFCISVSVARGSAMKVPMREVRWCCAEIQQCWPWLLVPISILDPNDPSPAKLKLNAVHSGVSFMLKENRTDFLLRSPNTRSEVSLREGSTKPLPFTLDSSKVLWLAGLGSEQHLVSAVRFTFPFCRHCPGISPAQVQQGRAEQTRVLAPSSLSAAGISSQSKGRSAHFVAHL